MNTKRSRYQHGPLTIERRQNGSAVWVYRWREQNSHGDSLRRKRVIGTKDELPTKAAAKRAVDGIRLEINAEASSLSPMTVNELIEHYLRVELGEDMGKSLRTRQVYTYHLNKVIAPTWGDLRLRDIKPVPVEAWLKKLTVAPATKAKTKVVMGVLFQHAMRYGWASANPMRLVRQSALPLHEHVVLEPCEIAALLQELRDPFYTLLLLAAVTGLRRGEVFGLKWQDIRFVESEIRIDLLVGPAGFEPTTSTV